MSVHAVRSASRTLMAAAALLAVASAAQAGDFVVRARALYLDPANESSPITSLGVPADAVAINSKYIWEVDASYFVTPNVALELIATNPQSQTVTLGGTRIGTLKHLPPTLTAQYHFAPSNPTVRPYIGLGVNYTLFSSAKLDAGPVLGSSTPLEIEKHSWGVAYNFGADFPITDKISLNVDCKKIDIQTDVKVKGGAKLTTVKVDPVLFGIGIGYKF